MSLNKQALTNYYNFAVKNQPQEKCAKCGEVMKGWAKSKCSVCNRFFCQSHMTPYLGPHKKCPDCWERIQSLGKSDAVPAAFQQATELYVQNNEAAKDLENKLFASIFGPNNLIKFAAEEEENVEAPTDIVPDTNGNLPSQEVPQQVEAPAEAPAETQESQEPQAEIIVDSQINNFVAQQANEFLREISSLNSELTPDQIEELFKEKLTALISQSQS